MKQEKKNLKNKFYKQESKQIVRKIQMKAEKLMNKKYIFNVDVDDLYINNNNKMKKKEKFRKLKLMIVAIDEPDIYIR